MTAYVYDDLAKVAAVSGVLRAVAVLHGAEAHVDQVLTPLLLYYYFIFQCYAAHLNK